MFLFLLNGPFSCCLKAKLKAIHMKMFSISRANNIHFHKKGFALGLDLKVRVFGTRNWPISGSRNAPPSLWGRALRVDT